MAAAYDTYDYPSYWEGREYEHLSEVITIKAFLERIPKIRTILEVGAGFGRLTSIYSFRAKKIILTDPSAKLLRLARDRHKDKKIQFIQSKLENLHEKVKSGSADLIIFVRVLHHIEDLEKAFTFVERLLRKGGYLIIEFPNKRHLKATFLEFLKGNFTFPIDIFPKDIRSKKSLKKKTLPFVNYHPDTIFDTLKKTGFKVEDFRSVSNIRSTFIKKIIPLETLLFLEKRLQIPFSKIYFGPSIFVLAKKIG